MVWNVMIGTLSVTLPATSRITAPALLGRTPLIEDWNVIIGLLVVVFLPALTVAIAGLFGSGRIAHVLDKTDYPFKTENYDRLAHCRYESVVSILALLTAAAFIIGFARGVPWLAYVSLPAPVIIFIASKIYKSTGKGHRFQKKQPKTPQK